MKMEYKIASLHNMKNPNMVDAHNQINTMTFLTPGLKSVYWTPADCYNICQLHYFPRNCETKVKWLVD